MNHGTGYWIWKLNRDRNKKYNHVTMYKNNMHPEKVMVTIGMSFYSLNGEQIITSYPVDGTMHGLFRRRAGSEDINFLFT